MWKKKVQKNVDARFNKSTSKRLHNVRIKEGKKCTRERERVERREVENVRYEVADKTNVKK